MASTLDGVDVSYAQGSIDWPAVAANGFTFVACKATQYQKDVDFTANQAGMRKFCIDAVLVYYHFLTGEAAAVQAARFFNAVGPLQAGELVALDVEASGSIPEFAPEFVLSVLAEITRLFSSTPLVYMGAYYRQADDARYLAFPLWLPGYSDNPHTVRPYLVHQFTDKANVPGLGVVDGDHVVDLAALDDLARHPAAKQPSEVHPMIATTSNADGRLEVFQGKLGGTVRHRWQTAPNSGWSDWVDMGPDIVAGRGLVAGRNADGRLELFAEDNDYTVRHCWQTAPNSGWSAWVTL